MHITDGSLHIGKLRLDNRLILAPMAGMLRLSLRMAYRRAGAAMTCVGVIDAGAVAKSGSGRLINILGRQEITNMEEEPVSVQLIGADAGLMSAVAERIESQVSIIDLNFSCPIKRFANRGYGASSLLGDPLHIEKIVAAVVNRVKVPVTVKIRVGFQGDDVDVLRVAKGCEAAGAAAIVVHGRTVNQGYTGPSCWDWIKRVKQNVSIPVVGNGGVHSPQDAMAMLEQTGCDFVMIGTAAFINPMIFIQTHRYMTTGTLPSDNATLALLQFFRHYWRTSRQIDGYGPRKFLKRSCRHFLHLRSYMQRIQAGNITL